MGASRASYSRPQEPGPLTLVKRAPSQRPRLARADIACMGVGILLTLATSAFIARGRIFWEDEMLGWMLLHDPSWHHMLHAWKLGADGGGFAFYLTGRMWFALFGASGTSFRFYSAMCFGLAFAVTWIAARRFYPIWLVALAMFNTWFCSPLLVVHMAEGRFYGLMLLGAALTVWVTLIAAETPDGAPVSLYLSMFAAHALLTTSHLLGIVYSFFLLLAMVAADLLARRRRPMLYASGALAWLLLIPERAAIEASVAVGRPHFWTGPPGLRRFVGPYCSFSSEIAAVLLLLAIGVAVSRRRTRDGFAAILKNGFAARRPVYLVILTLLIVPIAFLAEGLLGPSLFIDRYLTPVTIGVALLTLEEAHLIKWSRLVPRSWARPVPGSQVPRVLRWAALTCFGFNLLVWIFLHRLPAQQENYTDALTAKLPKGIPVVCEDAWSFTELIGRQHASGVRYTYMLDWPESTAPTAPKIEVTQFHLMENWRAAGYFAGSINYRDDFLKQYREFLVLQVPYVTAGTPAAIGNPLVERFSRTPGYTVKRYTELKRGKLRETVWLVCRGTCGPSDARQHDP